MLRYTKKGEWVLDPFVGSGTTLIECRRLGRKIR
jgi:DNA modification methylase